MPAIGTEAANGGSLRATLVKKHKEVVSCVHLINSRLGLASAVCAKSTGPVVDVTTGREREIQQDCCARRTDHIERLHAWAPLLRLPQRHLRTGPCHRRVASV